MRLPLFTGMTAYLTRPEQRHSIRENGLRTIVENDCIHTRLPIATLVTGQLND